jgi:hypothetical protein
MGEHGPEPHHRRRGNVDAELRQVAFDEARDRVAAPGACVFVAGGGVRGRKSAAQPQASGVLRADLPQVEARGFDDLDSSEQRLARLPQQLRAGAAEQKRVRYVAKAR